MWVGLSAGQQDKATAFLQSPNKHRFNFALDCGLQKLSSLAVDG